MQGSKYSPSNILEYGSKDLNTNLKGVTFTALAGQVTSHDLKIDDDHLIDGASIITQLSALGDKITCQVIDKDNIFGYGANTILGQYVTDWYMDPNSTKQLNYESQYPAKVYAGLYLRIIYTSVGLVNVNVITNYRLHKVLW
jgi:hypothetical protein